MNLNVKDFTTDTSGKLTSVTTLDKTFYYTSESAPAPEVKLEDNKTKTISANGTVEITPSATYDAMKKVTATISVPAPPPATFIGYRCYLANSGDDSEASNISDDYILLLFSDENMTTAKDPSTLSNGDFVYAVYMDANAVNGYGITDGLLGSVAVIEDLSIKVDHKPSSSVICFDARDTGSNYIFMSTESPVGTKTLAYWLTQYRT